MKLLLILMLSQFFIGCAKGRLDVLNEQGNILGSCTAKFYWHWYGAKDSVDYLLYICAKEHRDNGNLISDNSIFDNDYSLPKAPEGEYGINVMRMPALNRARFQSKNMGIYWHQ